MLDGELLRRGGPKLPHCHLRRQDLVEAGQDRPEGAETASPLSAVPRRASVQLWTTAATFLHIRRVPGRPPRVSTRTGRAHRRLLSDRELLAPWRIAACGDVLTYNGRAWSSALGVDVGGGGLTSISSPSATFCVAVDRSFHAVTYDGRTWSKPIPIDPKGGGLTSVSCPSATFCVAVDFKGEALTYDAGSWVAHSPTPSIRASRWNPSRARRRPRVSLWIPPPRSGGFHQRRPPSPRSPGTRSPVDRSLSVSAQFHRPSPTTVGWATHKTRRSA